LSDKSRCMLQPIAEGSDRLLLSVRITRTGHLEWMDDSGTVALVYHEGGRWHARPNPNLGAPLTHHDTMEAALQQLLLGPCLAARDGETFP
jgi:hypothetical protein